MRWGALALQIKKKKRRDVSQDFPPSLPSTASLFKNSKKGRGGREQPRRERDDERWRWRLRAPMTQNTSTAEAEALIKEEEEAFFLS